MLPPPSTPAPPAVSFPHLCRVGAYSAGHIRQMPEMVSTSLCSGAASADPNRKTNLLHQRRAALRRTVWVDVSRERVRPSSSYCVCGLPYVHSDIVTAFNRTEATHIFLVVQSSHASVLHNHEEGRHDGAFLRSTMKGPKPSPQECCLTSGRAAELRLLLSIYFRDQLAKHNLTSESEQQ